MPDRSGIDPARRPALHAGATRDLLRFITCGSVDDGKSTLIGRLLYDSRLIYQDQLARLREDSRKHGSLDGALDLALLVDGLQAEREQGITIDVAYRAFSTARRSFIVADAPGHEQYTRNMATGAATADLAVVLVDARKGLTEQTRRHTTILSVLGVGHLVLAINKMDLVDWSEAVYEPITADYRNFVAGLGHADMISIPASALTGDNIITPSSSMRWHRGPTLLEALETAPLTRLREHAPFRMPVQWVNRPNAAFRGYAGTVVSGLVRPGDPVMICPSGGRRSSATCMAMSETVTNRRGCLSSVASRPGHINFIEGESDANNHLEHQFRASARSPGRPSPGGPATRHPVPARNQVSGRPVPN